MRYIQPLNLNIILEIMEDQKNQTAKQNKLPSSQPSQQNAIKIQQSPDQELDMNDLISHSQEQNFEEQSQNYSQIGQDYVYNQEDIGGTQSKDNEVQNKSDSEDSTHKSHYLKMVGMDTWSKIWKQIEKQEMERISKKIKNILRVEEGYYYQQKRKYDALDDGDGRRTKNKKYIDQGYKSDEDNFLNPKMKKSSYDERRVEKSRIMDNSGKRQYNNEKRARLAENRQQEEQKVYEIIQKRRKQLMNGQPRDVSLSNNSHQSKKNGGKRSMKHFNGQYENPYQPSEEQYQQNANKAAYFSSKMKMNHTPITAKPQSSYMKANGAGEFLPFPTTNTMKCSVVWDFFLYNETTNKAKCLFCDRLYTKHKSNTTPMLYHVRSKHSQEYIKKLVQKETKQRQMRKQKNDKERINKLRRVEKRADIRN